MIIEFSFQFWDKTGGVLTIGRTDFKDLVQPASVLRIKLPEGAKMLNANPPPSEIQSKTLIWNDACFILGVRDSAGNLISSCENFISLISQKR